MAYAVLKRSGMVKSMASYARGEPSISWMSKGFASFGVGTDLFSTAPNVSLQKAGGGPSISWMSRAFASVAVGADLVSTAPNVSIQKARTWDDGVSSKFSTTSLNDIFKGAFTGVCSAQHVPSYKNNIDMFKAKGIDSAVNDPYTMNGWAEKLQAKDDTEVYGDFNGSFHKSLDSGIDLSAALLGPRSHRWSAHMVDGKVKAPNVEKAPSEFNVSGGGVKALNVEKAPSEFNVSGGGVKAHNVEKAPSEFTVSGREATVLRPLSPHLTIYKPQLTSTSSILERIAWIFLVTIVCFISLLCSKASFLFFV